MGFFNEKQIIGMLTRNYTCSECGEKMEFEDENEEILICIKCGHSVDLEHYGLENEEDYESLYPTKEEVIGYDEDEEKDTGEYYEEEYDELSHDD